MLAELLVAAALAASGERTVGCGEVIGTVPFPHAGSADPRYRSRLVLGAVSAPGVLVPQSSRTGPPAWPQFSKWGMVIRGGGGAQVVVSVPPAWRNRVAISWGNAGHGVFHTVRFPRCGTDAGKGHAFAGGFFVKRVPACVPLRFTVGTRSTVLRFGITRRCR